MRTSTSVGGVVTDKRRQWLTLLLDTGKQEKVKVIKTNLRMGDRILVTYNRETGKLAGIHTEAPSIDWSLEPPEDKPEYPLWEDEI